jgi:hypothetical protein
MEHGTSTHELTSLIFNSSDFRISQAFPDSHVPHTTEFYNSLLRTAHIHTKAQRSETTAHVSAEWSYPVYEENGRFGVRVKVPFKRIEMRRLDQSGVRGGADLQDVRAIQPVVAETDSPDYSPAVQSEMMRMDFAESLVQSSDRNSVLDFSGVAKVGGKQVASSETNPSETAAQRLAVIKSPPGLIPRAPVAKSNVAKVLSDNSMPTTYSTLPADGSASYGKVYTFSDTSGFYNGLLDGNASDVKTRQANQAVKETLWLIPFGHETEAGKMSKTVKGVEFGSPMRILQDLSEQVTENVYEWLHDRGYHFESDAKSGIGDASIEFFYQQDFSSDLHAEARVGLGVPTGRDKEYYKNPYQVRLGNGGHWEVYFGGSAGWRPLSSLCFSADGNIAFVLNETETRCATYKGATVKNIGAKIDADIGWRYATLSLDCTMFHPESDSFSGVVGYQLYWKGRDDVSFKSTKAQSWLGKNYNGTTGVFDEYLVDLDHTVLAKNTNSLGHQVRAEASLRVGSYCELFAGGGYMFAGRYVPKNIDCYCGVNLTF